MCGVGGNCAPPANASPESNAYADTPMEIFPDFLEWFRCLNARSVEYLVVGGYAVGHHGHVRYTHDLDVWVKATHENAQKLMLALADFGFGGAGLKIEQFEIPAKMVRLGTPPTLIDVITKIDGLSWKEAQADAVTGDYGGAPIRLIGLASLRRNKLASGRAKDLADLEALRD